MLSRACYSTLKSSIRVPGPRPGTNITVVTKNPNLKPASKGKAGMVWESTLRARASTKAPGIMINHRKESRSTAGTAATVTPKPAAAQQPLRRCSAAAASRLLASPVRCEQQRLATLERLLAISKLDR